MNYNQKKGWESNWEFDFRPQSLGKQGLNEVRLGCITYHWKNLLKAYQILSSHFQKNLNLKMI
jgi:hypothetical protein